MRKGYKILLFTGIGCVAAALIILGIVFATSGFRMKNLVEASPDKSSNIESVDKIVKESFDGVKIVTEEDDVILKKSTDGTCRVEYTNRDNVNYQLSTEDGKLQLIQVENGWSGIGNLWPYLYSRLSEGIDFSDYKIVVTLPEEEYDSLEIKNVSGDTVSEDAFSFGTVSLDSTSGDITVKNLKNTESFTAAAASGDITLENAAVKENLSVSSVSGELTLDQVEASGAKATLSTVSGESRLENSVFQFLTAASTSGDVYLEFLDAGHLNISTVSGEVYGRIKGVREFDCSTVSGSVSVPGGGTTPWHIETVSGDIRIAN